MTRTPVYDNGEELRPLRETDLGGASPEELALRRVFETGYPANSAAVPDFSLIEKEALVLARKRRRWYHIRGLLGGFGLAQESQDGRTGRPLVLAFAGAAIGAALVFVGLHFHGGATQVGKGKEVGVVALESKRQVLNVEKGDLSEKTQHVLLNKARLNLVGNAEVVQENPQHTRVALKKGQVQVRVPRLSGGTLVVETSDAEVVVHGTEFLVVKEGDKETRVEVSEGLVEVRPVFGRRTPRFLRPGEKTVVLSAREHQRELAEKATVVIGAARCDEGLDILEQYLEGLEAGGDGSAAHYLLGSCAAERQEPAQALQQFEKALLQSKDPVRADNALARIAQLESARDPEAGRAAWRRYLSKFPSGLHSQIAKRRLLPE